MNGHIRDKVCSLLEKQGINDENLEKIIGSYNVTLNKKGVLSILFEYCTCTNGLRSSNCELSSLNANLLTGKLFSLKDLFKPDSDYAVRIHNFTICYMDNRGLPRENVEFIHGENGFYISDDGIVIYNDSSSFMGDGIYRIPIPYIYLIDIIEERGPLAKVII